MSHQHNVMHDQLLKYTWIRCNSRLGQLAEHIFWYNWMGCHSLWCLLSASSSIYPLASRVVSFKVFRKIPIHNLCHFLSALLYVAISPILLNMKDMPTFWLITFWLVNSILNLVQAPMVDSTGLLDFIYAQTFFMDAIRQVFTSSWDSEL